MRYLAKCTRCWRAWRKGSPALIGVVFLVFLGGTSCTLGETDSGLQVEQVLREFDEVRVYKANAAQVVEALLGALVEREEFPAASLQPQKEALLKDLDEHGWSEFSTSSVSLSATEIKALIPEAQKVYVGEQGGRYLMHVIIKPAEGAATQVELSATIISNTDAGPLGGRPLSSNDTLETDLFNAMEKRLAR